MFEKEYEGVVLNQRYRILDLIGKGGMGQVNRAIDRLSQQTIALKQVTAPHETLRLSVSTTTDFRLALAQEFRTLASLRHPHIISVLDYGFDSEKQPFFTMELLQQPLSITQASRSLSYEQKRGLFLQLLHAIEYLHRRSIVHRDLKPDNVLVITSTQGLHVKVLDFGLAMAHTQPQNGEEMVGTPHYMAPELLAGAPHSRQSDLFAVGLIAYDIFSGHHPFYQGDMTQALGAILSVEPDLGTLQVEENVRSVIGRLLQKSPYDRFPSAHTVLTELNAAQENESIRESYLQAAAFVGRDKELAQLNHALHEALKNQGSLWLIGGESGSGKSRLVDEVRALALVDGAIVMRVQFITESRQSYAAWQDALRQLCLLVTVNDLEASILQPLIPDVSRLLERDIPEGSSLDPQAARERLLYTIESMFRRTQTPCVILLEDLHWIDADNLEIVQRLGRLAPQQPLLILATYRQDERPGLADELPSAQRMPLERLSQEHIADLSASMLGDETGRQPQVIDLIQRETEGNIFFIVEVMRALAATTGNLRSIGQKTLPQSVFAHGVRAVLLQRLTRIRPEDRALLDLAAVVGRFIDTELLQAVLHIRGDSIDLEGWLMRISDAAVIDVSDNRWRFAHDKLREAILTELTVETRHDLHTQIANALKQIRPHEFAGLAYHYGLAGNALQEGEAARQAAEQALTQQAYRQALVFIERALDLQTVCHWDAAIRVRLYQQAGDAAFGLGDSFRAREYWLQALKHAGQPSPLAGGTVLRAIHEVLIQIARRWGLPAWGARLSRDQAADLLPIYQEVAQTFFQDNRPMTIIYLALRGLNLGEYGRTSRLAEIYAGMQVILGTIPLHGLAQRYGRLARQHLGSDLPPIRKMRMLNTGAIYYLGIADWDQAEADSKAAVALAQTTGARLQIALARLTLGDVAYRKGHFAESVALFHQVYMQAVEDQNERYQLWGMSYKLMSLLLMGDLEESLALFEAITRISVPKLQLETILNSSLHAMAAYYQGDTQAAREKAIESLSQIQTVSLWIYPLATAINQVGHVLFGLWEQADTAERHALHPHLLMVWKMAKKFSRIYPFGEPALDYWAAVVALTQDKRDDAARHFTRSLTSAQAKRMRYDAGLAARDLGRLTHDKDLISQGVADLTACGALVDVLRVQEHESL